MASSKTFASGAVLTAADLNTYVNPSTAAHVPYAVAAGTTVSITLSAATDSSGVTVTFPTGRFTAAPIVQVTPQATTAGLWATVANVTATGCTVYLHARASATTSATVGWTATQMTTTNGAG